MEVKNNSVKHDIYARLKRIYYIIQNRQYKKS